MARIRNPLTKRSAQPVAKRGNGGNPARRTDLSIELGDGRKLTNAAIVYGLGAALIYILAFYNLANANWFHGIVLLIPSTSLAYLAYRYIQ